MAAQVEEVLMGMGSYSVGIDYRADLAAEFLNDQGKPRKVHLLFYDPDDTLIYTGVLLAVEGDETGLILSGRNLLWYLGDGEVGPVIVDQEYVSGSNKLSNGGLELEELYWLFAENTAWALQTGGAHAGSLALAHSTATAKDDIVQSEEKFPTRPGYEYVTAGWAKRTSGTVGRIRLRTVYEGRFDPPNVLPYGDFEDLIGWSLAPHIGIFPAAARSGNYGLLFDTIPKPQLVTGSDFSTGWTVGPTMSTGGGSLLLNEIPKPQYLDHVEADFTASPYVVYSNAVPGNSFSGIGFYRAIGPVGQHKILLNGSFEDGLNHWVQVAGAWSTSTAVAIHGANSLTTGGVAGGAMKSLQADADPGTANVQPFPVAEGEEWRIDGYIRSGDVGTSDEADGECRLEVYIVDQFFPANPSWLNVVTAYGTDLNKADWHYGQTTFSSQPDKPFIVPMLTIYGHTAGSWYGDGIQATRLRGNNTGIYTDELDAIPNQRYTFWAYVKSDARIAGSVSLRLIFKGAGKPDIESSSSLSQTYAQWKLIQVEATCPKGYNIMQAAIDGDDIGGGSFYVDGTYILLQKADNNVDRAPHTPIAVTPDQRYLLSATIQALYFVESGSVTIGVVLSGDGLDDETVQVEHTFAEDEQDKPARVSVEVRPGPGYDTATPFVLSKDVSGGEGAPLISVSNFTLVKMDNNTDVTESTQFPVTAERTYRAQGYARSGADLQRGTVHFEVRYLGEGRDDIIEEFSAIQPTDGDWKLHHFDFTPPSGYNVAALRAISTDVEGATWAVDDLTVVDQDRSTVIFDFPAPIAQHGYTLMAQDTTAPAGAEFVRVEVVAEAGADGYVVDSVNLWRDGVTPATGNAIVADMLSGLPVVAGSVNCPEVIPYDWLILNRTRRDALSHFCDVVSEPRREYHLNADRTLDVGTPATVFADHGPGSATPVILLVDDLDVEELPPTVRDVESRPTHVKVIGAERQTVSGAPLLISATSAVPGAAETDWNGLPITRTKIVSDATVDHFGYAQAYADDLAAKEAEPPLALNAKLTGINTRPPFKVGDWIYAYDPEAGLEDAGNATVIEGQPVFPCRVRVLSRTRDLGPQHRIEVRRTDGTTFDLTGILWSAEDATSLVIGDRFPEWAADPQAQAAGVQYLRDRASSPR